MRTHNDDRLTIGEAAAYLGVAPHTLRAWTREGRVVATRTPACQRACHLAACDGVWAGASVSSCAAFRAPSSAPLSASRIANFRLFGK